MHNITVDFITTYSETFHTKTTAVYAYVVHSKATTKHSTTPSPSFPVTEAFILNIISSSQANSHFINPHFVNFYDVILHKIVFDGRNKSLTTH